MPRPKEPLLPERPFSVLFKPAVRLYAPFMPPNAPPSPRPRLAAVDLDGTLLGPNHTISPANAAAVARLQAAGVEVVLASGRHYDAMQLFARQLPGVHWVVSVQGAEVANLTRTRVLHQSFLHATSAQHVLALGQRLAYPALVYAHEGIITDSPAAIDAYARHIGHHPRLVSTEEFRATPTFKIVWVGEPEKLAALATDPAVFAMPTDKTRSHRHLFEFTQPGVTKATGLAALAAHLGIARDDTFGFGDADNDVPMFDWVRTSVAMPHGWPTALARATHVAPAGPPETAFARAVDLIFPSASAIVP